MRKTFFSVLSVVVTIVSLVALVLSAAAAWIGPPY